MIATAAAPIKPPATAPRFAGKDFSPIGNLSDVEAVAKKMGKGAPGSRDSSPQPNRSIACALW
jgi:hypothetical protein